MLDYQFMSRNVRAFMSLFHSDKPVVRKVHGFCVAGGTDLALCSDLIVAEDRCKKLSMQKLVINSTVQARGMSTTQTLGTVLDGISRHTAQGYAFQKSVFEKGARDAVRERDQPFGDFGPSTFRG